MSSAADCTFGAPEVLEQILLHLHPCAVFGIQGVQKCFQATILGSSALRKKLWIDPPRAEQLQPTLNPWILSRKRRLGIASYQIKGESAELIFRDPPALPSLDSGSWREMLVLNPTNKLEGELVVGHRGYFEADGRGGAAKGKHIEFTHLVMAVPLSEAMRMGELVDVLRWKHPGWPECR